MRHYVIRVCVGLTCMALIGGVLVCGETETQAGGCSLQELDKNIEEVAKTGSMQTISKVWQQFYQCKANFKQEVDRIFSGLSDYETRALELLTDKVGSHDRDLAHNVFLDQQLTWMALRRAMQLGCLDYMNEAHSLELESGDDALAKVSQLLCMSIHSKLRPLLSLLREVMKDDQLMSSLETDLKKKLISARVCQRIVQYYAVNTKQINNTKQPPQPPALSTDSS